MVILSNSDYFQVITATLVADYDKDTLANFYQPIIGCKAFSLYLSLLREAQNQKVSKMVTHENLFLMLGMSAGDFIETRKSLEAIGLIKTFLVEENGSKLYSYIVYAPKTPSEFLSDTLLHGTLIKCAGDTYVKRLKDIYHFDLDTSELGEDISKSFNDMFAPDLNNPVYLRALDTGKSISRNKQKIITAFSYDVFFQELAKVSQITSTNLTKKEMKEIDRISSLYGLKEDIMASLVATQYNPANEKGKRINFEALTIACQEETNYAYSAPKKTVATSSKVSSDTNLARKICLMESTSPRDYLSLQQNWSKPAVSDLKIIDSLSKNFNLPNSVINAIVDFTLAVNHNVLSRAYCEKIAASVAREGLTNTLDTMNYLKSVFKGQKKNNSYQAKNIKTTAKSHKKTTNKSQEPEMEIDDILALWDEGDNENGKA